MKKKIIYILFSILGLFAIAGFAIAQIGGGVSTPSPARPVGVNWIPIQALYEWGSNANRWAKGWFTDLDVSGVFTLGGVVAPGGINFPDNVKAIFGTGNDAAIYYDGANLIIDPKEVGAGTVDLNGDLHTDRWSGLDHNTLLGVGVAGAGNLNPGGVPIAQFNTAFGYQTMYEITNGIDNSAFGYRALHNLTTGLDNFGMGYQSLFSLTEGDDNVAIGQSALYDNILGDNNTAVGSGAGYTVLGSGNVFLGDHAGYNETGSNTLYIANSSTATPLIYGDFSVPSLTINGAVDLVANNLTTSGTIEGGILLSNNGTSTITIGGAAAAGYSVISNMHLILQASGAGNQMLLKSPNLIGFQPHGEGADYAFWSSDGSNLILDTAGSGDLYIKGDDDLLLQPDDDINITGVDVLFNSTGNVTIAPGTDVILNPSSYVQIPDVYLGAGIAVPLNQLHVKGPQADKFAVVQIESDSGHCYLSMNQPTINKNVGTLIYGGDPVVHKWYGPDYVNFSTEANSYLRYYSNYKGIGALYMYDAGPVVFNEGGHADADLRMESDTEDYMFFLDAGANTIRMGNSDGANYLQVSSTGVITLAGSAKRDLTLRADLDYTLITAQGKPTQATIGVIHGYSMPIYNNDNEELFFNENVPGRWDGVSNITFDVLVALALAETAGETFQFQLSWNQVGETDVVPATSHDTTDEITVVDGTQYATYMLEFTIDYDVDAGDAIISHDDLAGRLRRVASTGDEVDGEVIVLDWHTHYTVDKMFKAPE